MENNNETIDSSNDDQEKNDVDLSDLDLSEDDDADTVKEKAQKAIDLAKKVSSDNKQLFNRTKKAEGFVLKDGKWVKPETKQKEENNGSNSSEQQRTTPEDKVQLTPVDVIALTRANVHEDDMQDVLDWAKFKKVSVAEALKSDTMKGVLAKKAEHRESATAANTSKARPSNVKPSGEKLLEHANTTGELPDSDKELDALLDQRYEK